MLGDNVRLAKKCLDPSAVAHFPSQLLNSLGEATSAKLLVKYLLPCLETEPVIDSLWLL